jgi:hypothetical protein
MNICGCTHSHAKLPDIAPFFRSCLPPAQVQRLADKEPETLANLVSVRERVISGCCLPAPPCLPVPQLCCRGRP